MPIGHVDSSAPACGGSSRGETWCAMWHEGGRRGPDSNAPSTHWSPCPRASLGPSRPSFIGEVRAVGSARTLPGVLRMAATSLQRSKTALGASFRRIARYKGGAVAVFATARQLARLIYRMRRYGHDYVDVGEKAYEQQVEPAPRQHHGNRRNPRLYPRPQRCRGVSFRSRKAYCSQVTPSTTLGPTSVAPVMPSGLQLGPRHRKRSSSGTEKPYFSSSMSASFPIVGGAGTVA